MLRTLAVTMAIAASSFCGLANAADDVSTLISSCAKDTRTPSCPVTYQTIGASDCLKSQSEGNAACLIRLATEAAAANDCNRAYRLVYACECGSYREDAQNTIKAAGPTGVCTALRGMK